MPPFNPAARSAPIRAESGTILERRSTGLHEENRQHLMRKIEIPAPPRTREAVVPDVNRGPLFIKQDKFYSALDFLTSMKELVASMQDEVYRLNETLRKDISTLESLDHILVETSRKDEEIKEIISPTHK